MTNDNMTSDEMGDSLDLRRYFFLLLQWLWLIVLVAVIAGGVAYYFNARITPVYQSSTLLLVSSPAQSVVGTNSVVASYFAADTYAQMLTNEPVLKQIISGLNISLTPAALKRMITVSVVPNTQMLKATVEDTDPQRAADIANQLGIVFVSRIKELQGERYKTSKSDLLNQIATMDNQINITNTELQKAKDWQATQGWQPTQPPQPTQEPLPTRDPLANPTETLVPTQTLVPTYTVMPTPVSEDRIRLEANLAQFRTIYNNLVTSYQQVQLAEAQTNDTVTQVDPANVPSSPVRPKPMQSALLAALVGAMIAAGGVVGIDALDDTFRDPGELTKRTGLPILGVIPFSKTEEKGLVTQLEPRSPISEAYRELRTNIQFAHASKKLDRIVVTSPTPSDGKTTIASNLAVILAQSGRKVVLMDADLRRPMVNQMFDISSRPGLTGLFLKQVELTEAARSVGVDNLVVITSGVQSPNPAEMLGSERMKELLDEIQQVNEVLILDTPPQLSVTDSSVLIPVIDGIILVVRVGQTHVSAIMQAVNNLRRLGANVVGLVVNGVKFNNSRYSYYYKSKYYTGYYYSQSYGYGTDGKKDKRKKRSSKPGVSEESSK